MDVLSASWLTEMEMEDVTLVHQYGHMQFPSDSLDNFDFFCDDFSSWPSSTPYLSDSRIENFQTGVLEKPAKQPKSSTSGSGKFCPTGPRTAEASSSSPCLISFGNSDSNLINNVDALTFYGRKALDGVSNSIQNMHLEYSYQNRDCSLTYDQGTKRLTLTRDPLWNQEHVLAERKRREKINLLFISLSAIVPGLTKKDKVSVLGEAVKYLKQLQKRVKMLEEETAKKMVESVLTVKRYEVSENDDQDEIISSSYDNSDSSSNSNQPLLQIEVRVSNKDALIRIHCQKQKGLAVRILGEIEKLHLTVINSSFIPFGEYIMDITIVAQMDKDFSATAKDLVRNLRLASTVHVTCRTK